MEKKEKSKKEAASAAVEKKKTKVVGTRGRIYQGKVVKKFSHRVSLEFERTIKISKYERFMKKKTRIHARLPEKLSKDIYIGDLIRVQECRPLSKIIHSIVLGKVEKEDSKKAKEKKE